MNCWKRGSTFYTLIHLSFSKHLFYLLTVSTGTFQVAIVVKNSPANAGDLRDLRDVVSIVGLGKSLERGHGNPLLIT